MSHLLEIKNLQIQYKTDLETVYAVNDISFTLDKGKTIGLVGETGAGKTTAALSILRLLPDRTGVVSKDSEIYFDGLNIMELSEADMRAIRGDRIAMIFQDPMTSLNPVMNVGVQIGEVIMLHNPTWSKAQIEERVEEVLTLVGIMPQRKTEYPHQFSGGMKQRVVIAIALASEPELLIADEPTTALDVTIQAQVLRMIRELRERLNTAMIMITHDLGIVAQTCDHVAVIYAGEIVEISTTQDMFVSHKHHPYTDGLFGSIPSLTKKTARLSPIPGLMPDPTELIEGCRFAPRCLKRLPICQSTRPPFYAEGTKKIKCHLYENESVGEGSDHA